MLLYFINTWQESKDESNDEFVIVFCIFLNYSFQLKLIQEIPKNHFQF